MKAGDDRRRRATAALPAERRPLADGGMLGETRVHPPWSPAPPPYHRCIAAISPSLKVKGRDLRLSLRTLVRPVTFMLPTRRETLGCSSAARLLCSDFTIVGLRWNKQAVFMRTPEVGGQFAEDLLWRKMLVFR